MLVREESMERTWPEGENEYVFQYEAEDDNGSQMFVNIPLKAVKAGGDSIFRWQIHYSITSEDLQQSGGKEWHSCQSMILNKLIK